MVVAFFDSGVGGLTVLHAAMLKMPELKYIYYADSDNVPYGTRSQLEIKKFVSNAAEFLMTKKIDALVIACNTATSVIVSELRNMYSIPIIGMEPAIKPALELIAHKNVLLCATDRTLKEDKLKQLITSLNAHDRISLLSLQTLVEFAEKLELDSLQIRNYFSEVFAKIDWSLFGCVVLGCTHFIFYKNILRNILPSHVKILDGNNGTVNRLQSLIDVNSVSVINEAPICDFYISGRETDSEYFNRYMKFLETVQ